MKKILLSAGFLISIQLYAQHQKIKGRLYLNPGIGFSPIVHRIFNDGDITSITVTKKIEIVWGGGIEVLKDLKNNFYLAGDLAFILKGNLKTYDTVYSRGSIAGYSFSNEGLSYIETTIFLEKQVPLKNLNNRILFSSGLFYGIHGSHLGSLILQGSKSDFGNDFGAILSLGIQRRGFFTKFDFKKGLINMKNDKNILFKTNVLTLKVGLTI